MRVSDTLRLCFRHFVSGKFQSTATENNQGNCAFLPHKNRTQRFGIHGHHQTNWFLWQAVQARDLELMWI